MKKVIKLLVIIILYSLIIFGAYFLINEDFRSLLENNITKYYVKNMKYDVAISPMTKDVYFSADGYATSSSNIYINFSKRKIFYVEEYYVLVEKDNYSYKIKTKSITEEDVSKIKNIVENLESEDVDTKGINKKKFDEFRYDETYYNIKFNDEKITVEDLPKELSDIVF